ncbi:MAG: hypothetical protein FWJ70_02495 [Micromonosporaceae bacterium]|jgi:hypothetical protein
MIDVAGGDPAVDRQLRRSLQVLRDRSDNAEFQRLVDEVLAGRKGLRDVATSPVFASELRPLVERFAEQYAQLSEEDRRQLAEQGERQLAEERENLERERAERERNSR